VRSRPQLLTPSLSGVVLLLALAGCPRGAAPAEHVQTDTEPGLEQGTTRVAPVAGDDADAEAQTWRAPPVRPLEGAQAREEGETRIVLGAVGDVLMHGEVQGSATLHPKGYRSLFAGIEEELRAPDITFANLETPVAPESRAAGMMSFNAPVELVTALGEAGINVVSVANNHIYDRGRRGLDATLKHVREAGLAPVGAGLPPREAGPEIIEVRGVRVGFLAWTQVLNTEGTPCPPSRRCAQVAVMTKWDPVLAQVRAAAAKVDALVVSLHWGTEYALVPDEGQDTLATLLVRAGADVVLGHHPHVPQRVDRIRRKDGSYGVVAYSLGNLISNQARLYRSGRDVPEAAAPRDGLFLRVELAQAPTPKDGSRPRARVVGADVLPLWTENLRGRGEGPHIEVVATEAALQSLTDGGGEAPPDDRRTLAQRRRLYRERLTFMKKHLGEGWVRAPGAKASHVEVDQASAAAP
jgi:poly-gamma-glutamate capsule biosynthesis protein CapA/YwtB (metallophosphatase superfamily)